MTELSTIIRILVSRTTSPILSLKLREECRLRVFKNRVLRIIHEPKRDEVMGGWRKLHDKDLCDLNPLPSIIRMTKSRKMRWVGACSMNGREEEYIYVISGKARSQHTTRKTRI
jgi:hypothetical protein